MAIGLPSFFRVWSQLGREAYDAEERIGHANEPQTAVLNDHWLRASGVIRYPLSTNTLGRGQLFDSATYGGGVTGAAIPTEVVYTSRITLAEDRVRVRARVHWGTAGAAPGVVIGPVQATINIYDGNTGVVLDTHTTPALTVAGTYSIDTYTSVNLVSSDVRVEVVSTITPGPPTGLFRLFGCIVAEDAMNVGEL